MCMRNRSPYCLQISFLSALPPPPASSVFGVKPVEQVLRQGPGAPDTAPASPAPAAVAAPRGGRALEAQAGGTGMRATRARELQPLSGFPGFKFQPRLLVGTAQRGPQAGVDEAGGDRPAHRTSGAAAQRPCKGCRSPGTNGSPCCPRNQTPTGFSAFTGLAGWTADTIFPS